MVVGTGMNSALLSSRDNTHSLLEELNLKDNAFFLSSMVPKIHQVPNLNTSQSEEKTVHNFVHECNNYRNFGFNWVRPVQKHYIFLLQLLQCIMYVRNLEKLSKNIRQVTILIVSKLSF